MQTSNVIPAPHNTEDNFQISDLLDPSVSRSHPGAVGKNQQRFLDICEMEISHAPSQARTYGYFQLKNRRYLGNKHRLLGFIEDIISHQCGTIDSFCDIFAGTGVVGERFNRAAKIISNDFLSSNYVCLQTFMGISSDIKAEVTKKIRLLNDLESTQQNYFSTHFGRTYFAEHNAKKIGAIREAIDDIAKNDDEKNMLICALIYASDKAANTVGHYDAFRKDMDTMRPLNLLIPDVDYSYNGNNEIYKEDANALIRKISCDVLYIDPPYNSRQYCDAYHVLENLTEWNKPTVTGVGKKMNRDHIKSHYCIKTAKQAFADLIQHANCQHILLSYNNTGNSKDARSNARMSDADILQILNEKGKVTIFQQNHKAFTTGRSGGATNVERIFYCKVTKQPC